MSLQNQIEELRNPACELCDLCSTSEAKGKKLVCLMGKGNTESPIVFIGEALGATEVLQEEPFVGDAGHLLNLAIQNAGYDREQVFVTNAVRCRPPSNETPKSKHLKACRTYLEQELALLKPKLICVLGNPAMESVLKIKGITKYRGQEIWSEEFKCNVYPVFHPAYVLRDVLRDDSHKDIFFNDVKNVMNIAFGGSIKEKEKYNYFVVSTIDEFRKAKKFLLKYDDLAVDTETYMSDPREGRILCLGFSWEEGSAITIPILGQNCEELWSLPEWDEIMNGLNEILYTRNLTLQNGKYDMQFLIMAGFDKDKLFNSWNKDTMLMHHLLDENSNHGLDDLSLKFTDMGAYYQELDEEKERILKEINKGRKDDKILKDEFTYDLFPNEILWRYQNFDVDATKRLETKFTLDLEKFPRLKLLFEEITMPEAKILTEMEMHGIQIDIERLDANIEKLSIRLRDVEEKLLDNENVRKVERYMMKRATEDLEKRYKELKKKKLSWEKYKDKYIKEEDYKFNFSSSQQLQILFYDALHLKEIINPKTKRPTLDRKALETYAEEHPFCNDILEYRNLQQFLSTFMIGVRNKIGKDGRLRTNFLQHGTVTGRLSSKNPNFQNIPKLKKGDVDPMMVRECYISKEGYQLVEADFKQLEFRLFADVSKDPLLFEDITNGLDVHAKMAFRVYEVTPESPDYKEKRRLAKDVVFGTLYGESAWALARRLKIPEEEAKAIQNAFFGEYPDAFNCINVVREQAIEDGYVENYFGRRRRFPILKLPYHELRKKEWSEALRQAFNFKIQGTAGDLTAFAMIRLDKKIKKLGIDAKMLIQIHDAIVFEVKNEDLDRLCNLIKKEMPRQVMDIEIPLGVDIEYGERWSELKKYYDNLYWFYHAESDSYFTATKECHYSRGDIDSHISTELGKATTPNDVNEAYELEKKIEEEYAKKE